MKQPKFSDIASFQTGEVLILQSGEGLSVTRRKVFVVFKPATDNVNVDYKPCDLVRIILYFNDRDSRFFHKTNPLSRGWDRFEWADRDKGLLNIVGPNKIIAVLTPKHYNVIFERTFILNGTVNYSLKWYCEKSLPFLDTAQSEEEKIERISKFNYT